MMKRGKYIVLESGEGFGKTTHLLRIKEFFEEQKIPFILTLEPGGTKVGKRIRTILLDPDSEEPLPLTKLYLYSADRIEHARRIIRPNLRKGINVLGDRSQISSRVYQRVEGINPNTINELEKITNPVPIDLGLIIDGDPEQGLKNAGMNTNEFGKPDTFERKDLEFHQKLREGYLEEISQNLGRYVKINYIHNDPQAMQEQIRHHIKEYLGI